MVSRVTDASESKPSRGHEISKDEVALYDRQIRLWGVESQARLRKASVYVVGVTATTLEMAKNLVLSGIGRIALHDPREVTAEDLETQYYFGADDVGCPRDAVLADRLAVLNPLVDVHSTDDTVGVGYDLVVAVGTGGGGDARLPASRAVNARCRDAGVPFIAADAFGLFGYIFADCLDSHQYVEEQTDGAAADEPVRRLLRASYKPLDISCAAAMDIGNVKRAVRKYPPLVFICQALASCADCHGKQLSEDELCSIVRRSIQGRGIPDSMVDQALIGRVAASWATEYVPCAAVVGGTLAQEVLKVVTGKDMPVNNWFAYDALSGDGIQCCI
ncbi:E1 ubiquitin-activating protein aos1 [Coemansia sp. BCRC 34490]|nr:E1 ubiquitin-activating protein aos1 [Coemansia sp. BCRC 34490]